MTETPLLSAMNEVNEGEQTVRSTVWGFEASVRYFWRRCRTKISPEGTETVSFESLTLRQKNEIRFYYLKTLPFSFRHKKSTSNLWSAERAELDRRMGPALCKIRMWTNGALARVIIITDKPQKSIPAGVWEPLLPPATVGQEVTA